MGDASRLVSCASDSRTGYFPERKKVATVDEITISSTNWPRKEDGNYSIRTGYYAAKEDYLARNQENPSTSTDKRDLWRESQDAPKVRELIKEGVGWNKSKIFSMFPKQTSEAIIRTPISVVNKKDCLYWPRKEDGNSIRTGYYAAKEDYLARNQENLSTSTDKRDLWREIWKMEVSPKIKTHLWKASQNILPVYTILYKKKILDSPLCQICLKENESVEHALLLCEWVRAVWFGAECQCIPTAETVSSLKNWLMDNIKKIRAEGEEDQERRISRIGFLLWEKEINPSWIIKKAKLLEYSYWGAAEKKAETKTVEIRRRNANLVHWRPPPDDWLKANVDATFKKEYGNGTISAVVRDKEGKVLLGFIGKNQANSSIIAEATAIRQALIIVNNLQLEKILIESDNQRLVQTIKSESFIGKAWVIIQDIQILLEALPEKRLT
ncbi:hypothetical protein AHAS_Ahas01G0095100 [Arachis hypogaea]